MPDPTPEDLEMEDRVNSQPVNATIDGAVITLVPYTELTPQEQETLHAWFDGHGVDHRHVPINPVMSQSGGVLNVEVYDTRDGKKYVGSDGEVVKRWVSVVMTSPLPWPHWTAEWEQDWIQQRTQAAEASPGAAE